MRPLTSSARLRKLVGALLRSRHAQLARSPRHDYLHLGCGDQVLPGFVNVDHDWRPGVLCWDLTDGLPFADATFRGVFLEHGLEHLPLDRGFALLEEIRRVLRPDGLARIVVPDARLYLRTYFDAKDGARFPYQDADGFRGLHTPMMSVNRVFYVQREHPYGHQFMYDFETLGALLREAGFDPVVETAFGEGADPRLLVDTPARRVESLYVEARRPA